jgi:hypothetical protein
MKTDFRGTEITEFLRCPKRYDYAWVQNLEPKQRNEKLTIGSAIHKYLESLYRFLDHKQAKSTMLEYLQQESALAEEQFEEMKDLCLNICENYFMTYQLDLSWAGLLVESEFKIALDDETNYIGTVDLLVKDKDGLIWLVDHKTTNQIDIFDKNSDMDRQISRYWYAMDTMFPTWKVDGFIYNIILKDYPQPPKQLKSGALSKDKSQKTNLYLYLQAIKDNNLKEEEYEDFLDYLDQNPKEFFRRVKIERTEQERLAAIDEMEDVILDIRDKQSNGRWYRNITKDCHWDCAFKTLCQAEMDGSNADHIRTELFKVKDV